MYRKEKSPYPWKGVNHIDVKEKKGDGLNLNEGSYIMSSITFDVLVDKREGFDLESYDLLRSFHHDNAIPLLDYIQDGKYGCLVVPRVKTSFQSWFEDIGKTLLFDEGHMTSIFEKLIIEYSDVIESLLKLKLILEDFDMGKLYVNVFDGLPTLCILLTKVTRVENIGVVHRKCTWDGPRKFISWCEKQCNITRDHLTESLYAFLWKSNCDVSKLKRYPHNWDHAIKGEYLMLLVASHHGDMRFLLSDSGLTWPFLENLPHRSDSLPELLQLILDWDKLERKTEHNVSDFFSYIILLRNCYKHLDSLPKEIKDILINRRALIDHIEMWTPDFWIGVYEIVGWPSSTKRRRRH